MAEHEQHCPFLNRADERCSPHFRLDHLGDALDHCFSEYPACPLYRELLAERQIRRSLAAAGGGGRAAGGNRHGPTPPRPLVQLTFPHRHAQPGRGNPVVPAVSGV